MITFGPFKLGLPVMRGESGHEYFGLDHGTPVAIWRYPRADDDVQASLQDSLALGARFPAGRWQRLERAGVEEGSPWLLGELVRGVSLGRLINSRRYEDDRRKYQDKPLPDEIAVGIGLAFARASLERAVVPMSEREFRSSTNFTDHWSMRVEWNGKLRPALNPLAFASRRPLSGPSSFDLVTPEALAEGQLAHRAQSDVFQAAALIGFLLRTDGLFGSNPQEILERVRAPEPQPLALLLPAAAPKLREVLQAALARDPAVRTASLAQLIDQLTPFGDEATAQRWLADDLSAHHPDQRVEQERSFSELGGAALEPIPPELEQHVLEHRYDESAWLILGDWLAAAQLARGELVMRHHRERQGRVVLHEELTAFEQEALLGIDHLYGPYALKLFYRYAYVDAVAHQEELTAGIGRRRVLGVEVNPGRRPLRFPGEVERELAQTLDLPSMRFLRAVLIDSDCGELDAVVSALAFARHRAVEEVFVPANRVADVEARLRPKLPRLKQVRACTSDSDANLRALLRQ